MAIPARGRVGIIAILVGLGLFGSAVYWFQTRTFVALDQPVFLQHGHIVVPEFHINLSESYSVRIEMDDRLRPPYTVCSEESVLLTEWILRKNGQVIERYKDTPLDPSVYSYRTEIGGFKAEKATYQIDVNELSDPSCLNAADPHLRIAIDGFAYDQYREWRVWVEWLAVLLAVVGVGLLIPSKALPFREEGTDQRLTPWAPLTLHSKGWELVKSIRERRARFRAGPWERGSLLHVPFVVSNPAQAIPTLSLCAVLCLLTTIWLPWWVIGGAERRTSVGLKIRVLGPRTVVSNDLANEWLIVRIDGEEHWSLNSVPVTPGELPRALRARLARQSSQIVYLDAASNLEFYVAARAIAIIRHEDAVVILLTSDAAQLKGGTKAR